ncbi:MAG: 16S rRNA (cytosine(1402)-N(4))-methyltransferase RsmH [Muribaculaceae bacterium]|nr:16S rRNA (cytosine(1402)-N(4))-methyltransferase RsmH [Muribaculaceae bacterium]MDE6135254.1 16S rRNA (cytosine(1402)-N(4))-methyltransferase RsmH [Muribaculaceae bacterium]
MNGEVYHIPALLPETLEALAIRPEGTYIDCTLGGGGHSRAILERLGPDGRLYSLDRDIEAIERAASLAAEDPRFTPVHGNFRFLENYADYYGITGDTDGILADLGVSFHHFDAAERGFSFRADGPLDMRMNTLGGRTAADLLAQAEEEELAGIFRLYGEFAQARRLAAAIVRERRQGTPVDTTARLASVAEPFTNPARRKQELAQVFQALRIVVNGELEALEAFLASTLSVLAPGGRLAIITYHSLEDRLVKNFIRSGRTDGKIEKDIFGRCALPLRAVGKPVAPSEAEILANPRSRSARLRIAEKI